VIIKGRMPVNFLLKEHTSNLYLAQTNDDSLPIPDELKNSTSKIILMPISAVTRLDNL
jgi:hypothetical protein